MNDQTALETVTQLSREFGSDTYVKGGGGNTSCKNADTLFVKPSGTMLADMNPESFLAIDRHILSGMYTTDFPKGTNEREAAVVAFMAKTIRPGYSGRPSVETPLHNAFPQRFVIHTHPTEVNGLTCGNDGAATCAKLFPQALWVEFFEPGYTLSMRVRERMQAYEREHGCAPEILFLENHGVFIAHDEAEGIRDLYEQVMYGVRSRIVEAGLNTLPVQGAEPPGEKTHPVAALLGSVIGDDAGYCAVGGGFAVPEGAVSPDHVVYCKGHLFFGSPDAASLSAFREKHGYWPRVVVTDDAVYGLGTTQKSAELALEFAWDAALVRQYAGAFGGMHFLEERFVEFIDNWEVESYRRKVAE